MSEHDFVLHSDDLGGLIGAGEDGVDWVQVVGSIAWFVESPPQQLGKGGHICLHCCLLLLYFAMQLRLL